MICANCKNEIGENQTCHLCGYNPIIDNNPTANGTPIVIMPPIEVVIKKDSNGMATAGLILSIFSFFPVINLLSFIFSLIGLIKAKNARSGHLRATLGLIFTLIFTFLFIVVVYLSAGGATL